MTYRRFKNLAVHLPEESATKTALARRVPDDGDRKPDPFADISDWSLTDQLLAHLVDLVAISNWQRGGGKSKKPRLMTAGTRRTAKPAEGVDVRGVLGRMAPRSDGQEGESPSQ